MRPEDESSKERTETYRKRKRGGAESPGHGGKGHGGESCLRKRSSRTNKIQRGELVRGEVGPPLRPQHTKKAGGRQPKKDKKNHTHKKRAGAEKTSTQTKARFRSATYQKNKSGGHAKKGKIEPERTEKKEKGAERMLRWEDKSVKITVVGALVRRSGRRSFVEGKIHQWKSWGL